MNGITKFCINGAVGVIYKKYFVNRWEKVAACIVFRLDVVKDFTAG